VKEKRLEVRKKNGVMRLSLSKLQSKKEVSKITCFRFRKFYRKSASFFPSNVLSAFIISASRLFAPENKPLPNSFRLNFKGEKRKFSKYIFHRSEKIEPQREYS